MKTPQLVALILALLLAGCTSGDSASRDDEDNAPFVKTTPLKASEAKTLSLSGEVRARYETPLAFLVNGRIEAREVDDGDYVSQGQIVFRIDDKDLREELQAAMAEMEAAESTLALASSDLKRDQRLFDDQHISQQTVDRTELREREARSRLNATQARVELARNALSYANLQAPADGVITEVRGEPGQVVNAGTVVATLAHDGPRELELHFPDSVQPPLQGVIPRAEDGPVALSRREMSRALDRRSRTRKVRYRIEGDGKSPELGRIMRAEFTFPNDHARSWRVPVSAMDERGDRAVVWVVDDGKAQPVTVELARVSRSEATIRGNLERDARIIAMGTHLLEPGMAVRELAE